MRRARCRKGLLSSYVQTLRAALQRSTKLRVRCSKRLRARREVCIQLEDKPDIMAVRGYHIKMEDAPEVRMNNLSVTEIVVVILILMLAGFSGLLNKRRAKPVSPLRWIIYGVLALALFCLVRPLLEQYQALTNITE